MIPRILGILAVLVFFSSLASAADYQCVFDNSIARINCNLAGASASFCQLSGPGSVANNPAVATTCVNSTPTQAGQIICKLRNYTGSVNSIRCSNTPSFVSGPTLVGGGSPGNAGGNCPYNDCELNQISCASAYAYQQCVSSTTDARCNEWKATNCVANAPCYSTTPAQLATCAGIPAAQIETRAGVYFVAGAGSPGNSGSPGNADSNPSNASPLVITNSAGEQITVKFDFFGDGVFNITFKFSNGQEKKYGTEIKNGIVVKFQEGFLPNPTGEITITEAAVRAIAQSSNPLKEVKHQMEIGGIVYKPVGIFEQIKFFFFRLYLNFV